MIEITTQRIVFSDTPELGPHAKVIFGLSDEGIEGRVTFTIKQAEDYAEYYLNPTKQIDDEDVLKIARERLHVLTTFLPGMTQKWVAP